MSNEKSILGIATHSAHFNIYPRVSQYSERIVSFGKYYKETIILTITVHSNPDMKVEELEILVNGHSITDGVIKNTVSMLSHSRTFKLSEVNTVDLVLNKDEEDDITGDYSISIPL